MGIYLQSLGDAINLPRSCLLPTHNPSCKVQLLARARQHSRVHPIRSSSETLCPIPGGSQDSLALLTAFNPLLADGMH